MTSYNVIVDLAARVTPARADKLVDQLEGLHPAVSPNEHGGTEVVVTIEDEALDTAAVRVLRRLQPLGQVVSLAVMTTEEFDRRVDAQPSSQEVDTKHAAELLGVSRQRIQQLHASGQLPGRKVGNSLALPLDAVEAYAATRTSGG